MIHVTEGGIPFIADENSLEDIWYYSIENRFLDIYDNTYLWEVLVNATDDKGRGGGYSYDYQLGEFHFIP